LLESFTEEKQGCTRFTEEITSSSVAPLPVSPSEKNTQKQIVEYPEDKHRFTAYPDHFLSLITTIRQKKTKLGIENQFLPSSRQEHSGSILRV
jgi:hypothetical protein